MNKDTSPQNGPAVNGHHLAFEDGTAAQIDAWPGLAAWALTLDDATYPDLAHLAGFGWADGLDAVADQLDHALEDAPPDDPAVADSAAALAEALDGRDPDEPAIVMEGPAPEAPVPISLGDLHAALDLFDRHAPSLAGLLGATGAD